ncbi:MAG: hypothetical protein ACE361_13640 [Aureliella sp.]
MKSADNKPEEADVTLEWQIERYVLGCDDWDCEEFENELENDPDLAQRVAEAVGDLMLLKSATAGLPIPGEVVKEAEELDHKRRPLDPKSRMDSISLLQVVATLAAMILLCVGLAWSVNLGMSDSLRIEAANPEISQVAATWVELNPVVQGAIVEEPVDYWAVDSEDSYDEFSSEDELTDDWLYLGGQDYFLETSDAKAES